MLGDHSWLLTPSKSAFRVKEGKKFCFIKHHVWYFCEKSHLTSFTMWNMVQKKTRPIIGCTVVDAVPLIHPLPVHEHVCFALFRAKKELSNHCDHLHVSEGFAHYSLVFPLLCSSCSTKSYALAGCFSLSVYVTIKHKLLTFLLALKCLRRLRGNISSQEAGHFVLKSTWFLQSVAGMSNVM